MKREQWKGFNSGEWEREINVRDFIQKNYSAYYGDEKFLCGATARTAAMMERVNALFAAEREAGGVLDVATDEVSSLLSYKPGYVDKKNELIVGLQTDAPLKRAVNPFGGMRMVRSACEAYGYELSDKIEEYFKYRTTHNNGVFRVYTEEMKKARHAALLTGLPDAYGRVVGRHLSLAIPVVLQS